MIGENDIIRDEYEVRGSNYSDFKNAVKDMVSHTARTIVNLKDFMVLLYIGDDESGQYYHFKAIDPENSETIIKYRVKKDTIPSELGDEMTKTNKLVLFSKKDKYLLFVARNAINTLAYNTGTGGQNISFDTIGRNMYIAENMKNDVSLITRFITVNEKNYPKLFAVLSPNYKYTPQTCIFELYEGFTDSSYFGEGECERYSVSHYISEIKINYCEKAEEFAKVYESKDTSMIPGLLIRSSDCGASSFAISGVLKINGHDIYTDKVSMTHKGIIDLEKIEKECKEKIFDKFNALPDALINLVGIDITPSSLDLSTEKGRDSNKSKVLDAYVKVFKHIGLVAITSKKIEKQLKEQISFEIDGGNHYTAYDVVIDCMGLADRLSGISKMKIDALRYALNKAPYTPFKEIEETVILTA